MSHRGAYMASIDDKLQNSATNLVIFGWRGIVIASVTHPIRPSKICLDQCLETIHDSSYIYSADQSYMKPVHF